ncbi:hypothetical protein [Rubellimicrobium roseum]|uniref:Uncharacterized protein n=1 Tax=Rubellimicrobium roseum TaxID=687525 RepID=A0A5C4NBM5_9RHOB|nr:hypothetical protein [Rubellimicrobium roseum]TNC65039.1 hypothetical protein FHG71_18120 [Rubellimicrobium roseum]
MPLRLHNPTNDSHIEDLEARLADHLRRTPINPWNPGCRSAQVRALTDVVRAMDRGFVSPELAARLYADVRIDGFCFDRWLDEMRDEGVYVDVTQRLAA